MSFLRSSLTLAALLLALLSLASAQICGSGEGVIASNLQYPANTPIDLIGVTNTTIFAESFRTNATGAPFVVASAIIRVGQTPATGILEIWTDNDDINNGPFEMILRLGTFSIDPSAVSEQEVFANEEVSLLGDTIYWLVVRSVDGSPVEWTTSAGPGPQGGEGTVLNRYSISNDAGLTWNSNDDNSSFFQINRCGDMATPAPPSPPPIGGDGGSGDGGDGGIGGDGGSGDGGDGGDGSSASRATSWFHELF